MRGKYRMVLGNAVGGFRGEDRGKPELRGPHRPAREPVVTHVPRESIRIPDYTITKPRRVAGLRQRLLTLLRSDGRRPCRPAHPPTGSQLRPSAGTNAVLSQREIA